MTKWGKRSIHFALEEMNMAFLRVRDKRDDVVMLDTFFRDHLDGHWHRPGVPFY